MMTIYFSRSFPRSNSSFFLCSGNALKSEVLRLREDIFLMDAGPPEFVCKMSLQECQSTEPPGLRIRCLLPSLGLDKDDFPEAPKETYGSFLI